MASKGTNSFKLHTFCVITGASKGFGKCMAKRFAEKLPVDSVLVLLARSEDQLVKLQQEIHQLAPRIHVKVIKMDLGSVTEADIEVMFERLFKELDIVASDFEQALIVHNAASLGDVSKKFTQMDNSKELQKYFDLNLTSCIVLNTIFLKRFKETDVKQRLVVGITSICALQPFKTWSLYCAGKAARDMLFRTMAIEDPSIRVLNYAPGPIDTEMQLEARTITGDTELKNLFFDMHAKSTLLTCDTSMDKLMKLLTDNSFDTGAHIDFYDC